MIGNSSTLKIGIEVDDKGSMKIRNLGKMSEEAGRQGERGFAGMRRSLNDLDRSSKVTLGTLRNIAIAAAAMATAAAAAVTVGMMKSVNAASDLAETTSKFNTVFGDQVEKANAWTTELVSGYAMSTREARQYLGSVQDLLVPMGMQRDAAAEMSNQVVRLSADLGSFNNLPTAQVMDDIQSALVGNYETMKKYGVVLNATTVQEKALTMGLAATKEELTAGMRAQAAYALMVEGSTAAIGDMARTGDGYANQLKKFHATIEDLTAAFGTRLLPIATDVIAKINVALTGSAGGVDALAQSLTVKLVTAIKWVVQAVQFMHNGFNGLVLIGQVIITAFATVFDFLAKGLRTILEPLDLIFAGLVKLNMIDANPFDKLSLAATSFREVTGQVLDEHIAKIERQNTGYNAAITTLDGYIKQAGAVKSAEESSAQATAANAAAMEEGADAAGESAVRYQESQGQVKKFTEAVQQSSIYMGEEALAYELSTEGMYGYKTAMQLAFATTTEMDGAVTGLTTTQDVLTGSTDGLADSYSGLAESTYQARDALAAYQAQAAQAAQTGAQYSAPAPIPAGSQTTAGGTGTGTTIVNNFNGQVNRGDIATISNEQARRAARG